MIWDEARRCGRRRFGPFDSDASHGSSASDEPWRVNARGRLPVPVTDAHELLDTRHYAVTKTNADAGTETGSKRAGSGPNPRDVG
jgi:hypothetical protein